MEIKKRHMLLRNILGWRSQTDRFPQPFSVSKQNINKIALEVCTSNISHRIKYHNVTIRFLQIIRIRLQVLAYRMFCLLANADIFHQQNLFNQTHLLCFVDGYDNIQNTIAPRIVDMSVRWANQTCRQNRLKTDSWFDGLYVFISIKRFLVF